MTHQQAATIFGLQIKGLKKKLPSNCSFLSPMKNKAGHVRVKAVVNKEEFLFSVPQDLVLTPADLNELERVILSKC